MLPTINLQLTDATALSGDFGESSPLSGGTARPEGNFADLLRAPVMLTPAGVDGQALPLTGNGLPLADEWPGTEVPDVNRNLLQVGSQTEFADTQTVRVMLEGQELALLAEDRAGKDVEQQVLPLLAPPAIDIRSRADTRSSTASAGSAQFIVTAGDGLEPAADSLPEDIAVAVERVTVVKSRTAEPAQRAPFTLQQADLAAAAQRAPAPETLSVGGDATQNTFSTPLPTTSPASNAAPLAAQPVFSPALGSTATAPLLETTIALPMQDPAWGDTLSERVVFMSGQKIQNAEIRLTPAELGPVRVSVSVEDGATNITFNAQHAATREAIEAALPRLREMLNEQGLSLGNASVADQGPNPDGRSGAAGDVADAAAACRRTSTGDSARMHQAGTVYEPHAGLVDTFA